MREAPAHLQGDKILGDGLVIAVDQMRDGLHHAVLDVVVHLSHQPEIQHRLHKGERAAFRKRAWSMREGVERWAKKGH